MTTEFELLVRRQGRIQVGDIAWSQVRREDRQVRLLVVRQRFELFCGVVDRRDGIAELDVLDAARAHELCGLLRHCTDDADPHVALLDDRVRVDPVRDLSRALRVHVRADVGEVRVRADAVTQIRVAAVEFVVAHRCGVRTDRVEHIHRGLVLLRGRRVGGGTDVVAGRQDGSLTVEGRAFAFGDGGDAVAGLCDPPMEVGDVEQLDLGAGGRIAECGQRRQWQHHPRGGRTSDHAAQESLLHRRPHNRRWVLRPRFL